VTSELTWTAPGPGDWWLVKEHFPYPVSHMFAEIFPDATRGWKDGGARYGLPTGLPRWAEVNHWIYYGPGIPLTEAELADREKTAAETLAGTPWRDEYRRWHDDERPLVVAANRALQAVEPVALDDAALLEHFQATIDNYLRFAPLHFEHSGFDVAAAMLFDAAADWDVDPARLIELLGGNSPVSAAVDAHIRTIAGALDEAGTTAPLTSVTGIRAASPAAAAALDDYLDDYGWRPLAGHDVLEPTVGERPELVVAVVNAVRERAPRAAHIDPAPEVRAEIPERERPHFDMLLADARASYALRDDDVGVCWNWPLGLIRRACLELGRRLVAADRLAEVHDLFECEVAEARSLMTGAGPPPEELAERRAAYDESSRIDPPLHLKGADTVDVSPALPPNVARLAAIRNAVWSVMPARVEAPLHGIGIGKGSAVGTARIVQHPDEIDRLADGDILLSIATTTAFNAVFPLLAGVVTQQGGLLSHAAILSRELELPAVVGVSDLFDGVRDGDVIEVDAAAGAVRVVSRTD
jgi:pyruvate,water dikinase